MHLIKEFGCILILKREQDSDIVNLLSLFKINEILYFKNKTEVLFAGKIYSLWKSFNLTHFPQKGVTMSFSSFNFSCSSRLIFPVFLRRILLPWWMTVKYTNRQMQRYRFSLEIEELKNRFQKIALLFSNVTTFKRWIKGWRLCHRCLFRTKKVWKQKVNYLSHRTVIFSNAIGRIHSIAYYLRHRASWVRRVSVVKFMWEI